MDLFSYSLSRDQWEAVLSWSELSSFVLAAGVAIGVVGELRAESKDEKQPPLAWRSPEYWLVRHRDWKRFWGVIVIICVALEAIADGAIWKASDKLEAISNRESAGLQKIAGDANERAGKAEKEAADSIAKAAALGVTVDNLNEVVNQKGDEANAAIARLDATTAALQDRVEAVQKQQQPRHLSDSDKAAIAQTATRCPGQKIFFSCSMGDDESCQYAGELQRAFQEAGWDVERMRRPMRAVLSRCQGLASRSNLIGSKLEPAELRLVSKWQKRLLSRPN